MSMLKIASLTAAILVFFSHGVHSRTVTSSRSSLSKRTVDFDASCNNYPQISQGLVDGENLAENAASVLNDINNPFVNGHPWDALRQTLFGAEGLSSTQAIMGMYNNIASDPDVKVFCDEPTPPKANTNCADFYSCASKGFDAYENFVDATWATPGNLNSDAYYEQLACGFQVGHNIVVCPSALPGGSRGFQSLASVDPGPGSNLDCYKSTWGAMFVHELSHVFGTRDWAPDYAYGFDPAKQIASDAANGQANGATPLTNADTFSLFALGVYSYSTNNPFISQFSDFEWSSGSGVQIVLTGE